MSDAMSRDDLVIAVNRLMICAMEDVDCGRDEAGPTTLDLVERIERHDRALRSENERLREALREQEEWEKQEEAHEDKCAYAACDFRGCPHDEVWAKRDQAKALRRAALAEVGR